MATRRQREASAAAAGHPVVDGEANCRRLIRSLSLQPNAATADKPNTIAPWSGTVTIVDSQMEMAVEKMESTDPLTEMCQRLADQSEESTRRTAGYLGKMAGNLGQIAGDLEQIAGDFQRLVAVINQLKSEKAQKEAQVQNVMEELESEKAQKEAQVQKVMELESENAQKEVEVQKVMEENVRLRAMLDKKETQLQVQAMSEQVTEASTTADHAADPVPGSVVPHPAQDEEDGPLEQRPSRPRILNRRIYGPEWQNK